MQATSIQAYRNLKGLGERQQQVLEALEGIYPATNRQVSVESGIPINVVTPRMGELVTKGRVEQAYKSDDNGRTAIYWRPVRELIQERLFGDTY